jgi:cytochrome c
VGTYRFLISCVLLATFSLHSCNSKPEQKKPVEKKDYIRAIPGKNDSIPAAIVNKGQVLIAYSDCSTCHKDNERAVGPAFHDVAKRYPVSNVYIEMLAHKVIMGGSGSWGYPKMAPHPKLSFEDAKAMVTYILSMKDTSLVSGKHD